MGYGHMRAAQPLARALNVELYRADAPPLADEVEARQWRKARGMYERLSRLTQVPFLGRPLRALHDQVTAIPHLYPYRDLSGSTFAVRYLDRLVRRGLGRGLAERLKKTGEPLLTTFYAPAIAADRLGCESVYCVVTDSDINRIWAPVDPRKTRIHYLVPTRRAMRRLRSYGVPAERIELTGFPLPDELVGGPNLSILRANLAKRLVRLDPAGVFRQDYQEELKHFLGELPKEEEGRPPLLTFAIGGAGAQVSLGLRLLRSFANGIREGKIQLALVAGIRREVYEDLHQEVVALKLEGVPGVQVLYEPSIDAYFTRFNELIARTDVLWTKPSELTFFGALGLPMVLSSPIGVHESYNRRWARENGAGLKQRDADYASEWVGDWLQDGTLAGAAWAGFMRMPKFGTHRIMSAMGLGDPARPLEQVG